MNPAPDIIINSPTPWWTVGTGVGAAVLAGIFATVGWIVVHRTSNAREIAKWRRDTITKTAHEFVIDVSLLQTIILTYLLTTDVNHMEQFVKMNEKMTALRASIFILDLCEAEQTRQQITQIVQEFQETISTFPKTNINAKSMDERKALNDRHTAKKLDATSIRDSAKSDIRKLPKQRHRLCQ